MKTFKTIPAVCAALLVVATSAKAWVITPVWEQFVSTNSAVMTTAIPILTNAWNALSNTANFQGGQDPIPLLGGFKRYDTNRLLLAVTENGIAENVDLATTNAALYALSTNYPDRSLIWINPTNSQPMGVALIVGLKPVELDAWYTNICATNTASNMSFGPNGGVSATNYYHQHWFDFDVSDDGYVYTGYKHKLLRYSPDGVGGLLPTPEVVLNMGVHTNTSGTVVLPTSSALNERQRWFGPDGMFTQIHVRGSGINTIVFFGGRGEGGLIHPTFLCTTTDGTYFNPDGRLQAGNSSTSGLMLAPTNYSTLAGELWFYKNSFPSSDNGNGENKAANYTSPATVPPYTPVGNNFPGWAIVKDITKTNPPTWTPYYRGNHTGALECKDNVPFMVTCEVPSWNSTNQYVSHGNPFWYKNGAIALHDVITGARLGWWLQNIKESDVKLANSGTANWFGTVAHLQINVLSGTDQPDGTYEVLWGSYCYGYGRYLVKNEGISITNVTHASDTSTVGFTLVNTDTNAAYVLQRTSSLSGTPVWQDVTNNVSPVVWPPPYNTAGTPLSDTNATGTDAYYRVRLQVP